MTYKFRAKRKTDLNINVLIPIYGEEPVLVQFHNGRFETDDKAIAESMLQSDYYKKLFVVDVPEPVKKVKEEDKKPKSKTKKKGSKMNRAKYLFIATHYNKFDIYCLHPDDKKKLDSGDITPSELKRKRYKATFLNGIYQTNDDREAEAIMAHPHYGDKGLFILDKDAGMQNMNVENQYGDDSAFAKRLEKMKLLQLKSIAHEKELASWGEIKRMTKEDLIRLMIRKKGLMAEYAT